jgi:hypothetical protein
MKEQAAKMKADLGPEEKKKMEQLRQRMEALAKAEADKALLEAEQARAEADLAAREGEMAGMAADRARMEAEMARMEADRAHAEAESKRLEAALMQPPAQSEIERRRAYAKQAYGGENTDRGRILMQYGDPGDITVHEGYSEIWRYISNAPGHILLEFEFDGSGKLVRRSGGNEARVEQDRRTKYANENWARQGGASSDKGKAYIKYGPPDEINTSSGGESWLYKNEAKDRVRLEVTFDGNGQGQWVKASWNAGGLGAGLSQHFQDVSGLR